MKIFILLLISCIIASGQSFTFNDLPWLSGNLAGGCSYSSDDQTSYTQGTNVNGENGGTCWTSAYVATLF